VTDGRREPGRAERRGGDVPHRAGRQAGAQLLVEIDAERVHASLAPLFADWVRSLDELYAGYTDDQRGTRRLTT
jgi:hypothetical protein